VGQGAAEIVAVGDTIEYVSEVVAWLPAQLSPRARIDVDAVDTWKHRPAARSVNVLVPWRATPHDCWCVRVKLPCIVLGKRRRRTDDVTAEANRAGLVERAQMRCDDILNVCPPIQELIHFHVVVLVCVPGVLSVVGLRKESRRAEDQAGQFVAAMNELAEILGSELRDAVDVLRHRHDVLGNPRRWRA